MVNPTTACGTKAMDTILAALGLDKRFIRRFSIHFSVDELVWMEGVAQDQETRVTWEEYVDSEALQSFADALDLEFKTSFQIAADWLDDHGHEKAAEALRNAR